MSHPILARALGFALIIAPFALAEAQEAPVPSAPPVEATGPDAAAAKAWIVGAWTMTMTPPEGETADPHAVTISFAEDGGLTIAFVDEADPDKGAWLVTAATPASASFLLDEDELDADPADDIYLDVDILGPDAGKGVLRSATGEDRLLVALTRGAAAPPAPEATPAPSPEAAPSPEPAPPAPPAPPAAGTAAASGPVTLLAEPPASIAGAIEAVKAAGAPDDARLESAAVDLNGDGTDEALVKITHMYWCSGGMDACRIWVLQKTPAGAWDSLGYPYAKGVAVLDSSTNGFRDLSFDGVTYVKGEYGGYARKE